MGGSSLLDLPTDIMLLIIESLDPRDVRQMAAVCHELAAIVSYIHYAAAGLSNPQVICSIKPSCRGYSDALTALSLDFQLVTIKQLVCNFSNDTTTVSSVQNLTWKVRRLCNVVSRLSSIGSVCITFHSMERPWSLASPEVQQFTIAFLRLLDIIMQRSCTSLHIQHSHPVAVEPNFRFQLVSGDKKDVLRSLVVGPSPSSELQGKKWKYNKIYESSIPLAHPPILSQSRLTHVDLNSDFLLIPPFSPWTFGILKSSPVTSLSLTLPQNINPVEFRHYIFPNLVNSLFLLQELKFTFHGHGALALVVENLPSLPHLQNLTLGNVYYGPFDSVCPEHDVNRISNLTSIAGSLDQVVYLLARLRFPSLKFINILIEFRFRLETHFVEIASRFSALNRLLCGTIIEPRISVRLLDQGDVLFDDQLQATMMPNEERTWITHFRNVSRLNLELTVYTQDAGQWPPEKQAEYATEYVLAWLQIFSGVTILTLTCRHPFLDASSDSAQKLWTAAISTAAYKEYPTIQNFDVMYVPEDYLRHWTCEGEEWGSGSVPSSGKAVECHFNPKTYSRSLKPEWVMHGDSDEE